MIYQFSVAKATLESQMSTCLSVTRTPLRIITNGQHASHSSCPKKGDLNRNSEQSMFGGNLLILIFIISLSQTVAVVVGGLNV